MALYKKILIYLLLIILAFVFLTPIYGIFTLSLKSIKELIYNYWGIPKDLMWQNFSHVWSGAVVSLRPYFINSFILTIPAVIFIIFFSLLAAYPLSKFKIKSENILLAIIIFGITIPHQVLIIPVFKMLNVVHLYNNILGLILVHIGYGIPFATFLLRNYMLQIPKELIDAAMVDGCSHYRIVFRIIFPLCKPAIAVLAILYFTWIFNEFFYALVLTSTKASMTASVAVGLMTADSSFSIYWNIQAAGALILTIPTLIIFLSFQKYFIKGIMLGSVKG